MKKTPYSRKLRQLDRLIKELKLKLSMNFFSIEIIAHLKLKIARLLKQLVFVLSKREAMAKLGSLAVIFGFTFTNFANAQSFAPPIANPFGITPPYTYVGSIEFADLDGDGDLDIIQGGYYGGFEFHENTGTASSPSFTASVLNPFGLTATYYFNFPTMTDLDNDGDLDILSGEYYGTLVYFENIGTPTSPSFAAADPNPFGLVSAYNFAMPNFVDLDGDGDMDLLVSEYGGNMLYFENTGSPIVPFFQAPVQNPFGLTAAYYFGSPEAADLDGDGDFDLLVGEYGGNMQYFENTGTAVAPAFAPFVTNPFGLSATYLFAFPAFGDLDNDGDLDLMVGEYYGSMQYFENFNPASVNEFSNDATIYPNPFIDKLTLESTLKIERIDVFTLSGKLMLSIDQPGDNLNLEVLNSGLYLLKATGADRSTSTHKLRKL